MLCGCCELSVIVLPHGKLTKFDVGERGVQNRGSESGFNYCKSSELKNAL